MCVHTLYQRWLPGFRRIRYLSRLSTPYLNKKPFCRDITYCDKRQPSRKLASCRSSARPSSYPKFFSSQHTALRTYGVHTFRYTSKFTDSSTTFPRRYGNKADSVAQLVPRSNTTRYYLNMKIILSLLTALHFTVAVLGANTGALQPADLAKPQSGKVHERDGAALPSEELWKRRGGGGGGGRGGGGGGGGGGGRGGSSGGGGRGGSGS